MKRITQSELARLSLTELRGLLRQTFNALAHTAPDTPEQRDALSALEAIRRELVGRGPGG